MRSTPWLDADLAQSRTLDFGESPSCPFMLFMVINTITNWSCQSVLQDITLQTLLQAFYVEVDQKALFDLCQLHIG